MKRFILFFIIVCQVSFAGSLDLRGIRIKVIDQNKQPIGQVSVEIRVEYRQRQFSPDCLFEGSLFCLFPVEETPFIVTSNGKGIIQFGQGRQFYINRLQGYEYMASIKFLNSSDIPKCYGLNYFERSPTAPGAESLPLMVYDRMIRISMHTVKEMQKKKNKEIVCQF